MNGNPPAACASLKSGLVLVDAPVERERHSLRGERRAVVEFDPEPQMEGVRRGRRTKCPACAPRARARHRCCSACSERALHTRGGGDEPLLGSHRWRVELVGVTAPKERQRPGGSGRLRCCGWAGLRCAGLSRDGLRNAATIVAAPAARNSARRLMVWVSHPVIPPLETAGA